MNPGSIKVIPDKAALQTLYARVYGTLAGVMDGMGAGTNRTYAPEMQLFEFGLDSLGITELGLAIEQAYGVSVEELNLTADDTLGTVVERIAVKKGLIMQKTYGQIGYEYYCEFTGWKSLATGADLPQWADTKPEIQSAWQNAAYGILKAAGDISLTKDGDQFCALLGQDLASGTAGFGVTPADAVGALAFEMAKTQPATGDLADLQFADEKADAQMQDGECCGGGCHK